MGTTGSSRPTPSPTPAGRCSSSRPPRAPEGAVWSDESVHAGFVTDLFSAFYPLAAASPVLRSLELDRHGLTWRHAPAVRAHVLPDDRCALLSRGTASHGRIARPLRRRRLRALDRDGRAARADPRAAAGRTVRPLSARAGSTRTSCPSVTRPPPSATAANRPRRTPVGCHPCRGRRVAARVVRCGYAIASSAEP